MKANHSKYFDGTVKHLPQSMFTRKPASKKQQERKAKFMARFYHANGKID